MEPDRNQAEIQFQAALLAGRKREYKKAITILESLALQGVSDRPEVLLYLARSYHAIKQYPLAVQAVNSYLQINEKDGNGWFFLGRSYLAMDSNIMAVKCLLRSLELKPDSSTTLGLLGSAYLKLKHSKAALDTFKAALYIDPDDPQLNQGYQNALLIEAIKTYNNGDFAMAVRMFEFLISNGMHAVMTHVYYAHSLKNTGAIEQALAEYRVGSRLSPNDSSLYWYEITTLTMMGKQEEAKKLIASLSARFPEEGFDTEQSNNQNEQESAILMIKNAVFSGKWKNVLDSGRMYIKLFGSDAIVHSFMGEAARNLGRYKDALNHFYKACALDSKVSAPRYGILMTYLSQKNWKLLNEELHKSDPDVQPFDQDTISYYSVICDAHLKKDSKQILDNVQREFKNHPSDPILMGIMADQYVAVDLPDLAINWYKRLIDINPNGKQAFIGLIECYTRLRKYKEAEKLYKSFLKKWKSVSSVRKNYIKLLVKQQRWKQAADQLELLIPYSQHTDILTKNLASYRRKAGQYKQSALLYRTILQKTPEDRIVMQHYVFCLVKMDMLEYAIHFIKLWHKAYGIDVEGALIESSLLLQALQTEKALETLRAAFSIFSSDIRIKKKIAEIYTKTGNLEMAKQFS